MNQTDNLDLMMQAWNEIMQEEKAKQSASSTGTNAPPTPPAPALPTLSMIINRIAPLPGEALFLGMANDGLPVLLNLHDPVPGPILIAGDKGSGKTRILQTIARATTLLHSADDVRYLIFTPNPEKWRNASESDNNAGMYHSRENNIVEVIQSLTEWAHTNRGNGQSILLLIDDLEAITTLDPQIEQNLRWLLLRGSSRRVWTFATLNADHAENQSAWLEFFRTRLFGFIEKNETALFLTGNSSLNHLAKGEEFATREGEHLLKFWLPTLD